MYSEAWLGAVRYRLEQSGLRRSIRHGFLRAGQHASPPVLANLRVMLGYVELGAWLGVPEVFRSKNDLFAEAVRWARGRVLYLEFGVYRGESLRWWSEHLRDPQARLVGFDSFGGLPEPWRPGLGAGKFRVPCSPAIDDARVSFEVGWFDRTLPTFVPSPHNQLIINVDCDLYSSTDTVLQWAEPHIRPGTLIYFDELPDRDHELLALREHLARSGHEIEPLGIAGGGLHWLFRYR